MTPQPLPAPSTPPDGPRPGPERLGEAGTAVLAALEPSPSPLPPPPSAGGVGAGPPAAQPAVQLLRSPLMGGIQLESGAPEGPVPEATRPSPALAGAPEPESVTAATVAAAVLVQPVPAKAACAVPPQRGIARERDWVRRTYGAQYHATAGIVSRVLSQAPGLRGSSRAMEGDALTDLVAVRLYLGGDSAAVDDAVRRATVGPHVPLARCVASGLRRLPSYRGAALLRSRVSHAERDWYRTGHTTTEWAFCTAQAAAHAGTEDGTDFLIWSMTARRTSLLDPGSPDRVIFAPGTAFKVLRAGSEADAPVLLREVLADERTQDGRADAPRLPLDEIALDGLDQALRVLDWAQEAAAAAAAAKPGTAPAGTPLGAPPGLITLASRSRTRVAGSTPAAARNTPVPAEGATL
ncbi:hypothetical protein [Streptomyces sp. NPDC091209]|uniref:hypothetical protein n=1 Tax=Streptomyces sp. NPDC091209 TaxID=3365974 RepID=UPI00380BC4CD